MTDPVSSLLAQARKAAAAQAVAQAAAQAAAAEIAARRAREASSLTANNPAPSAPLAGQ